MGLNWQDFAALALLLAAVLYLGRFARRAWKKSSAGGSCGSCSSGGCATEEEKQTGPKNLVSSEELLRTVITERKSS